MCDTRDSRQIWGDVRGEQVNIACTLEKKKIANADGLFESP